MIYIISLINYLITICILKSIMLYKRMQKRYFFIQQYIGDQIKHNSYHIAAWPHLIHCKNYFGKFSEISSQTNFNMSTLCE